MSGPGLLPFVSIIHKYEVITPYMIDSQSAPGLPSMEPLASLGTSPRRPRTRHFLSSRLVASLPHPSREPTRNPEAQLTQNPDDQNQRGSGRPTLPWGELLALGYSTMASIAERSPI